MNNDALRNFALGLIAQRLTPAQKADPTVQAMIRAIEQNDEEAGIRIATNLCQTYNVSKEDAINDLATKLRQTK